MRGLLACFSPFDPSFWFSFAGVRFQRGPLSLLYSHGFPTPSGLVTDAPKAELSQQPSPAATNHPGGMYGNTMVGAFLRMLLYDLDITYYTPNPLPTPRPVNPSAPVPLSPPFPLHRWRHAGVGFRCWATQPNPTATL